MNNYDFTDQLLKSARNIIVRNFSEYRSGKKDLSSTKSLYSKIKRFIDKMYLKIVRHYYKKFGGKKPKQFDDEWLYEFLMEFDPLTGYQFNNEWERKLYRQYEAVESTKSSKSIRKSMMLMNNQVTQKAIEATDYGVLKAYEEDGIKKVRWNCYNDDRACDECRERDGKIFDIKKVSKVHPNCRCWFTPVREDPNHTRQGSLKSQEDREV